jgi:hypothetical protein
MPSPIRAAVLLLAVTVAGCGATAEAAGPTCGEFVKMPSEQQTTALLEWARTHDERVDQDNPNAGFSGFALFQDRASMNMYCADEAHRDEHISELTPQAPTAP